MCETRNRVAVNPSPREAGNGWVLDAVFPNGEQAAIAGFSTASEANDWLGSAGHLSWLRATRATFGSRSAGEIFERLAACAIALTDAAGGFCRSIRRGWRDTETLRHEYRRISSILARLQASTWLWRAGQSGRRLRHRTAYRRSSAANVLLLVFVTALSILLAVLAAMGDGERPARLASGATPSTVDRALVPSHADAVTRTSDSIALLLDRVSSSETAIDPSEPAAESPPPPSAGDEAPAGAIPAAIPRRDPARTAPPAITGVWAPESGSCSARQGVLPAVIDERGAARGRDLLRVQGTKVDGNRFSHPGELHQWTRTLDQQRSFGRQRRPTGMDEQTWHAGVYALQIEYLISNSGVKLPRGCSPAALF
jgi:hypothetical protein